MRVRAEQLQELKRGIKDCLIKNHRVVKRATEEEQEEEDNEKYVNINVLHPELQQYFSQMDDHGTDMAKLYITRIPTPQALSVFLYGHEREYLRRGVVTNEESGLIEHPMLITTRIGGVDKRAATTDPDLIKKATRKGLKRGISSTLEANTIAEVATDAKYLNPAKDLEVKIAAHAAVYGIEIRGELDRLEKLEREKYLPSPRMTCPNCQAQFPDVGYKLCPFCGAKL